MQKTNWKVNPEKEKFISMYETYQAGNKEDFKTWLKKLKKPILLRFICHCVTFDFLDVYKIEKIINS